MLMLFIGLVIIIPTFHQLQPIRQEEIPEELDFPIVTGQSSLKSRILLCAQRQKLAEAQASMMLLDNRGNVLWYRRGDFQNGKVVRNKKKEIRYLYGHRWFIGNLFFLYVLDGEMNQIDYVTTKEYGDVYGNGPYTHDFLFLDDGHYVILINFRKSETRDFAIQEIKNSQVVYHWQSDQLCHRNYTAIMEKSHVNSIDIDPKDGNFIISCRNNGIFKLNKQTSQIMWLIGKKHQDFNLTEGQIPLYQHNVHLAKDGSIVAYDDAGYSDDYSRVVRYWLDEDKMEVVRFREYIYHQPRVEIFGGVQILDDENDILAITYGQRKESTYEDYKSMLVYEEYDFKNSKSLFSIRLSKVSSVYRITRLIE